MVVGLWCLTPLSTIFRIYRGGQFFVEETGVRGESTDLSQVTDKLYRITFDRVHLAMNGIQTNNVSDDRH